MGLITLVVQLNQQCLVLLKCFMVTILQMKLKMQL
ncbi:ORF126 [Staphylococcus phage 85]|uniref:ORF131 n=3 Tax=Dubowvirus TaxID=2842658 RepID=Q4ZDM2_9CAUD|nr:ORF131 [Staphylococcus phage 53]YP_239732.1 ORF126 [Staphylococcus phage 85]AAX90828.1 ORF130 [Staphylococcus phage 69]AAX90904.1 ORF131 [Staphylococcus phage 53]AAX90983.1 ORF126 [Staphylococcus phage 85]